MRLSTQGHSGLCTLCHRQVERKVGGIASNAGAGPATILCVPCARSGVIAELLGGAIADANAHVDEAHDPIDAETLLADFCARYRAALAAG